MGNRFLVLDIFVALLVWWAQDLIEQKFGIIVDPKKIYSCRDLVVVQSSVHRYDKYWDMNPIRMTLLPETIELLSSLDMPLTITVDISEKDSRYRMVQNTLRQIESTEVIIRRVNQHSRPPNQLPGLYFEWNESKSELTGAIYPATIHQTLSEIIQKTKPVLCVTQGGGANLFHSTTMNGLLSIVIQRECTLNR